MCLTNTYHVSKSKVEKILSKIAYRPFKDTIFHTSTRISTYPYIYIYMYKIVFLKTSEKFEDKENGAVDKR